ncbi:MAG: orotidine-5'-phosphate decarboxylase [Gemmatimonadaceae bacterium]
MTTFTSPATTPIVALDFADPEAALNMVEQLGQQCGFYKVGSELFTAAGPRIVRELRLRGCRVFLDLKLHDIPNTVARATAAAAALGVSIVTVHATGGEEMIRAAVTSAGEACDIFAVTVLTSLSPDALSSVWGREAPDLDMTWEVVRLAEIARRSGARGVVCSGQEAAAVRTHFGGDIQLLIPGVRLPGSEAGDQARVVTPAEAASAGASYIVLGRTVTSDPTPTAAMARVVASLG